MAGEKLNLSKIISQEMYQLSSVFLTKKIVSPKKCNKNHSKKYIVIVYNVMIVGIVYKKN